MERKRLSDAALDELAAIVERNHGKPDFTRDELEGFGMFLLTLAAHGVKRLRARRAAMSGLRDRPEGYAIESGYPGGCEVCGKGGFLWADVTGIKCESCYRAFRGRLVPRVAATDRDSWYSAGDLERCFGIGKRKSAKLAEVRTLNARKVHGSGFLLFIVADNPGVFPPRKALREAEEALGPDSREDAQFRKLTDGFSILEHSKLPNDKPENNR